MGPKSKFSKKEKVRMEAEQLELDKSEMEKENQKHLEEERAKQQKEREIAEKRHQQEINENQIRRKQLKESISYIDEIQKSVNAIKKEEKKKNEWAHYMRCDGTPNTNNPGDLRRYLYIWQTNMKEHNYNERNWLLQVNEKTLLTQDSNIPNLSRKFLRKQQKNLGDIYVKKIKDILKILNELDETLENKNIKQSIISDLVELKSEFRSSLTEFINDFTYKILSHVERDMEIDASGMPKYIYKSDVFKTQIWIMLSETHMNKDKFKDTGSSHTNLTFDILDLQLSIPSLVELQNSAIRGLWLIYDHFSDCCESYYLPKSKQKHLNILDQTKIEWKKRKEILQTSLSETDKEASIESYDLQVQHHESNVIDVDKLYTEYEDELNKVRRDQMQLNLSECDVNLRRYRIVGGVYCIDLIEQLQQDKRLNSYSLIRTVFHPETLKYKNFYQSYRPPAPTQPGVRRLPEEIEAEIKIIERNLDKLALLTVKLPDTVLWFEPPIVCRWETPEETLSSEINDEIVQISNTKVEQDIENENITDIADVHVKKRDSVNICHLPVKEIYDFDLTKIPNNVDLFGLMTEFIVPRLPDGYCIQIEYLEDEQNEIFMTKAQSIKKKLIKKVSPCSLYPRLEFNRILKIKEKPEHQKHLAYMFSELIQDLDELYESQKPFLDDTINELSSRTNSVNEDHDRSAQQQPRRFQGVIIARESDLQKDEVKDYAHKDEVDNKSEEDSGSEYEEKDDTNELRKVSKTNQVGKWSTRDIHDMKFNEDKFCVQFRTGRLGYFGFAANRYSNMPYQTWEIKPDMKNPGNILFSLTAAVISVEMTITSKGFCVTNFQGGSIEALNCIIGNRVPLDKLKQYLAECAINIFPNEDAFCYTEGSCEKNFVMEMHLYTCMSSLALSHNFLWSRWNLLSGSRTAVLLMRELIEGRKTPNYSTLYVTPLRAAVVDCTEVSVSFNTVGVSGMEFYADLHHLAQAHAHPLSREKRDKMNPLLLNNVAELLKSVRPLSFC